MQERRVSTERRREPRVTAINSMKAPAVFIVAAKRTAFGTFGGALKDVNARESVGPFLLPPLLGVSAATWAGRARARTLWWL